MGSWFSTFLSTPHTVIEPKRIDFDRCLFMYVERHNVDTPASAQPTFLCQHCVRTYQRTNYEIYYYAPPYGRTPVQLCAGCYGYWTYVKRGSAFMACIIFRHAFGLPKELCRTIMMILREDYLKKESIRLVFYLATSLVCISLN